MKANAVFFDRDGTLVHDAGYLSNPDQVRLVPGATWALRQLRRHGFLLVIVSNQSGIGRGLITHVEAQQVDRRFQEQLLEQRASPDRIYYCPHAASDNCKCRKPAPGLLWRAAIDLSIDLERSWMIGDKESDIETGRRAGCRTLLLRPNSCGAGWQEAVQRIVSLDARPWPQNI